MHGVEEEGEAEDVDVMERTRQYKPASVVPTTVEGTREALIREISECGYVVSQNFLSLISSWR